MSNTQHPKGAPVSFADVMADAGNGRTRATVPVCFSETIGERLGKLEQERQELAAAEESEARARADGKTAGRRLGAKRRTAADAESESAKLVGDNPTAFYDVVVQAAPRDEWVEMKAENPPRRDHPVDAQFNLNWDACAPLIVKMCLVDPEPTPKVLEWLGENMVPGEWDRVAASAWTLSEMGRSVPKSRSTTSSPAVSQAV